MKRLVFRFVGFPENPLNCVFVRFKVKTDPERLLSVIETEDWRLADAEVATVF